MSRLISFAIVRDLLMEEAGMTKRMAEDHLQRNTPPPHPHGCHSRRLWRREVVLDFCVAFVQRGEPSGEGVKDAES